MGLSWNSCMATSVMMNICVVVMVKREGGSKEEEAVGFERGGERVASVV